MYVNDKIINLRFREESERKSSKRARERVRAF